MDLDFNWALERLKKGSTDAERAKAAHELGELGDARAVPYLLRIDRKTPLRLAWLRHPSEREACGAESSLHIMHTVEDMQG
jgi:hypothetical protein